MMISIRTVDLREQNFGLHEKRLFITFRRKQDKKCMIAHFVALVTYFLNSCRKKMPLCLFLYKIFK